MPKECQISKGDSEIEDPELVSGQGSEWHPCHAELVSASHLHFDICHF
jgi:hypothetical protein